MWTRNEVKGQNLELGSTSVLLGRLFLNFTWWKIILVWTVAQTSIFWFLFMKHFPWSILFMKQVPDWNLRGLIAVKTDQTSIPLTSLKMAVFEYANSAWVGSNFGRFRPNFFTRMPKCPGISILRQNTISRNWRCGRYVKEFGAGLCGVKLHFYCCKTDCII